MIGQNRAVPGGQGFRQRRDGGDMGMEQLAIFGGTPVREQPLGYGSNGSRRMTYRQWRRCSETGI